MLQMQAVYFGHTFQRTVSPANNVTAVADKTPRYNHYPLFPDRDRHRFTIEFWPSCWCSTVSQK